METEYMRIRWRARSVLATTALGAGVVALAAPPLAANLATPADADDGRRSLRSASASGVRHPATAAGSIGVRQGSPAPAAAAGVVRDERGRPVGGAFVSARDSASGVTVTVFTGSDGRFTLPLTGRAAATITAHAAGYAPSTRPVAATGADVRLTPTADTLASFSSARFLAALPGGEFKRRFAIDCTGCHTFDERITHPGGKPRTRDDWVARIEQMVSMFGPSSGFPIIAPGRNAAATADSLTRFLAALPGAALRAAPPRPSPAALRATITEYDFPVPRDLPHDLMLDASGQVVITGMFTASMWVLDPATGRFRQEQIPLQGANPRALHVDADDTWWALLGGPRKVARRNPATKQWTFYDVGMYGHSIAPDSAGGIWTNGHFTANPSLLARVDRVTGEVKTYEVPPAASVPTGGGPIPYEIKAADDGTLWMSELHGNRVVSFTPRTEAFRAFDMPTPHSAPRRLDIAPDGTVWIPTYAGGALARLDPRSGRITEHPFPVANALPYIARVDRRTGMVWVATGAADAVGRFDPRTSRWELFPLPTRGALIRHIDVDPRTGAVWAAYGASPGIPARIARIETGTGDGTAGTRD
jgi:virginiamycin B lyase